MLCHELLTNLLSDTSDMRIVLGDLFIYLVLLLCRLYSNPLCRGVCYVRVSCACVFKTIIIIVVCLVTFSLHLNLSCNNYIFEASTAYLEIYIASYLKMLFKSAAFIYHDQCSQLAIYSNNAKNGSI